MRNCQTIRDKMGLSRGVKIRGSFVPKLSDNGQRDKSGTNWDINYFKHLREGLSVFVRLFVRRTGYSGGGTNSSPPPIGGTGLVPPCPGGVFMDKIDPVSGCFLSIRCPT